MQISKIIKYKSLNEQSCCSR